MNLPEELERSMKPAEFTECLFNLLMHRVGITHEEMMKAMSAYIKTRAEGHLNGHNPFDQRPDAWRLP